MVAVVVDFEAVPESAVVSEASVQRSFALRSRCFQVVPPEVEERDAQARTVHPRVSSWVVCWVVCSV